MTLSAEGIGHSFCMMRDQRRNMVSTLDDTLSRSERTFFFHYARPENVYGFNHWMTLSADERGHSYCMVRDQRRNMVDTHGLLL
jgi:hypothetical protein